MSGPMIELEGVSRRFGDKLAVDDVSLEIAAGEFFSLLGPSGCGKTTTLRMIAGFEDPDGGRVILDGEDVTYTSPKRRNVNMVFQDYALFPHMTVAENVSFGLRLKRVPRAETGPRVEEMLEVVRLGGLGDRRPAELSGGQRQRVALARALVNRPAALLLDEPLGALDLKLRREMQLELKRIQRTTGTAFVYVTHDQEEALTMSDRIAVMDAGRVQQLSDPEDALRAATHVLRRRLHRHVERAQLPRRSPRRRAGAARAGCRRADRGPPPMRGGRDAPYQRPPREDQDLARGRGRPRGWGRPFPGGRGRRRARLPRVRLADDGRACPAASAWRSTSSTTTSPASWSLEAVCC